MLAQGQSSSAKRGGLVAVSSGLIFLKKKKSTKFNGQVSLFQERIKKPIWLEFSFNLSHSPQTRIFHSLFWKYPMKQKFQKGKKHYFGLLAWFRCNTLFQEGRESALFGNWNSKTTSHVVQCRFLDWHRRKDCNIIICNCQFTYLKKRMWKAPQRHCSTAGV